MLLAYFHGSRHTVGRRGCSRCHMLIGRCTTLACVGITDTILWSLGLHQNPGSTVRGCHRRWGTPKTNVKGR